MKSKNNNIEWIDILRACAMLGVIIIHISTPILKMSFGKNMQYWWIGNIVDSAVRFSVPMFLMLSGATMLGREYPLKEYFIKRMFRVLFPFLFWMAVYLVFDWATLVPKRQPHGFNRILHWGTDLFLNAGISKHFWYIYMILFIYLFVPFIGKWIRKLSRSSILYVSIGWIVLTVCCKSVPLNLYTWKEDLFSKFLAYFLFSGYLVLGYYLSKLSGSSRIRLFASLLFILSVLSSSVLTYIFSKSAHKLDLSMYGYLAWNTIIQSISLFLWVKDSGITNRFLSTVQHTISDYSYGIYLVHVMVIDILFNYGVFWKMAYPLISLPLLAVLILIISFSIIFILRKIPFGNYISG